MHHFFIHSLWSGIACIHIFLVGLFRCPLSVVMSVPRALWQLPLIDVRWCIRAHTHIYVRMYNTNTCTRYYGYRPKPTSGGSCDIALISSLRIHLRTARTRFNSSNQLDHKANVHLGDEFVESFIIRVRWWKYFSIGALILMQLVSTRPDSVQIWMVDCWNIWHDLSDSNRNASHLVHWLFRFSG